MREYLTLLLTFFLFRYYIAAFPSWNKRVKLYSLFYLWKYVDKIAPLCFRKLRVNKPHYGKTSSFLFTVSDRVLMSHWQKVHKSSPSSVAIMIFIFPLKISEMKVLINVGLFNSIFWASYFVPTSAGVCSTTDGSVNNSTLHLNLRSLNIIKLYPGGVFWFKHLSLREYLLFHPVLSLVSYFFSSYIKRVYKIK